MIRSLIFSFVLLFILSPSSVSANAGIFSGAGNQVMPIKSNDIQLVREDVTIKLRIDEQDGIGFPFVPWAEVHAEFHLRNTKNERVKIEMGFPFIDLQGFGNEELVLSRLNFRVREVETERRIVLKEGIIEPTLDPQGLFKKVFVWEEHFQAQQTKKLIITYQLLFSVGSLTGDRVFPAISYFFNYITKTAYTWKGPVERAIFSMDCSDFFQRINQPDFAKRFGDGFPTTISRPVLLYNIEPSKFTREEGIFRWDFKGNIPEEGIKADFAVIFLPAFEKDLPTFLSDREKAFSKELFTSLSPSPEEKALAEETIKKEILTPLRDLYGRIVRKETKRQLLFEEDRQAISATFESLKALTTGSSGSAQNAPASH